MVSSRRNSGIPAITDHHQSIEPILYETVKLRGEESIFGGSYEKYFAFALASRPPSFFEKRIRNLCVTGSVPNESIPHLLSICIGVRNLALWKWTSPKSIPHIANLRLRSLEASMETIYELSKSHQIFPELTHLTAIRYTDDVTLPNLEWLPALTHIRIEVGEHNRSVRKDVLVILQSSRKLQYQIHHFDQWSSDAAQRESWTRADSRVVTQDEPIKYKALRVWEEKVACLT